MSFAEFLRKVGESPKDQKAELVDAFLKRQKSIPIIEDGIAHFVFNGEATDVALACDVFGARQEKKLLPVADTNLKYYALKLEPDQRVNYAYLVNYKPQLDELNPRQTTSSMYAGEMEFAVRLRNEKPLAMSWFGMANWKEPGFIRSLSDDMKGLDCREGFEG